MTYHRREVLRTLGAASAASLLWAFGCGGHPASPRRAPQVSGEVRTWLHDAVSRLAAVHPFAHALAVSRRRTTAARDVLGAGIARLRADGVVLTIRRHDGTWHEYAIAELSRDSVDAAARALDAARTARPIDFGRAPITPDEPPALDDRDLHRRLELLLQGDAALARRLVYAAAAIDIDDAIVWSVAPGRDLEQRLVRIRNTALRAAAGGTGRPVVREAERAWTGWLDGFPLTPDDLIAASEAALEVITPGGFDDGERTVILDPSVAASLLDTVARGLLTTTAALRPEVARRLADSAALASPVLTLVDDPTSPGAYGGFAFDDEGEPAAPITLIDAGRISGRLADRAGATRSITAGSAMSSGAGAGSNAAGSTTAGSTTAGSTTAGSATAGSTTAGRGRRAGHLGPLVPAFSHLRLVPGTGDLRQLLGDGFLLEGSLGASLDPGGDRIRIACARARELKAGNTTGQLYADVELVGSLTTLLTAIDAVAATPASFAPRGPAERDPLWRSIATPALRTRGLVRAVRSRA